MPCIKTSPGRQEFLISDNNNTESPHAVLIDNPDGLPVQTLEESQTISTTSSCPQTTPCSAAVPVMPTQTPTDMVGGNDMWPTTDGASPRTESDEFFNSLLCSALHDEVGAICKDEQINEDLLGRVFLGGGWNAVFDQARPVSCPLLPVLRYLDEVALRECRSIDRLALLHAVHTMYLVRSPSPVIPRKERLMQWQSIMVGRTSARQELPPWYRSRYVDICLFASQMVLQPILRT